MNSEFTEREINTVINPLESKVNYADYENSTYVVVSKVGFCTTLST